MKFINVGFGNLVSSEQTIAVVAPDTAPGRRLREAAQKANLLIDATSGRRTRAMIVTQSNHVILSALQPETLAQRLRESA